ncbi:MAG: hypothetical protein WCJ56_11875, partial [bacterium]
MTNLKCDELNDYYAKITAINIGVVARELFGDRITGESGGLIYLNCKLHTSISGKSLHVELDKQLWRCWGCGISGDVLQLVEMALYGVVTHGITGKMSDTHRGARDWLAAKAGLPKLSHMGLSDEKIAEIEARECTLRRAHEVLTVSADWYMERLLANEEALAWVQQQYGFTEEHVRQFHIGYADVHGLRAHLYEQQFTSEDLLSCGLFLPNDAGHEDHVLPFFANRVIFPYYCRGQVTYLIGRRTPWTDPSKYEENKYKKLLIHDSAKHPWITAEIANDHLYNEDLLSTRPKKVIITEGITDCIALLSQGFPAISPVTVTLRYADIPRLITKMRNVTEVIICQDNEVSQVGWQAALTTASQLQAAGIPCKVAELPLGELQQQARAELESRFNIVGRVVPKALDQLLEEYSAAEREEAQRLLGQAKIDVCQFFRDGGTAIEFDRIMRNAKSPLELAIADLSATKPLQEQQAEVEMILQQITKQPLLLHSTLLKEMRQRLGNTIGMTDLRQMLKGAAQDIAAQSRDNATPATEGELVFDDGQRRLFLINNGIVRETVRETTRGPIVTKIQVSNCHVRLTRDVITEGYSDDDGGFMLAQRDFQGRLIGDGWDAHFSIDSVKWPLNSDLASQISKAGGTNVLLEAGPYLDDIRRVAHSISSEIEAITIYNAFGYHA